MLETLSEFLNACFTGPVWPASLMLGLLLAYSVLILLGLADGDIDGPDIDTDGIGDISDSAGSFGALTVRWLNLDAIPIFVWMGIFGFFWWLVSLALWETFDRNHYAPLLTTSLLLAVRNIVIAVGITKILTMPMRGWFERSPAYRAEHVVGGECTVETSEATPDFGRARFRTDGAPLLINIRTTGEKLVKGQRAQVVDFDPTTRVYTVQSLEADQ